jgi:hypothetical protein
MTIFDEFGCLKTDPLLFRCLVLASIFKRRQPRTSAFLPGSRRPSMGPANHSRIMKEIEIAADRRFRGSRRLDKLRERNEAALTDDFRQSLTPFFRQEQSHQTKTSRIVPPASHQHIAKMTYFNHYQSYAFLFRQHKWGFWVVCADFNDRWSILPITV